MLFDSDSARHAVRRKRGLKAHRTRIARFGSQFQHDLNSACLIYGREATRLRFALEQLTGTRQIKCQCSGCLALKYGANPDLIRAEMVRLKKQLDEDIRELKRVWALEQHEKAMKRAADNESDVPPQKP